MAHRSHTHHRRLRSSRVVLAAIAAVLVAWAVAASIPEARAATGARISVANVEPGAVDLYLGDDLATGADGVAGYSSTDIGVWPPGPVTAHLFLHVANPPASAAARLDTEVNQNQLTIPDAGRASIVIGPSPYGGVLPGALLYVNDPSSPAPGTGRLVLRHTADLGPFDVQVVSMATVPWVTLATGTLQRGGELSVEVPVPGPNDQAQVLVTSKRVGEQYALPPPVWESVLVPRGQVIVADAANLGRQRLPSASCPDGVAIPPPDATDVSTIYADVDGDFGEEQVTTWAMGNGGSTSWYLGVRLPSGGGAVAQVTSPDLGPSGISPVGAADVNDDGRDEVLVSVAATGATQVLQVWGLVGCQLVPLRVQGAAQPFQLTVGTAGTSGSGAFCVYGEYSPDLNVLAVRGIGAPTVELDFTAYTIQGLELVPSLPTRTDVIAASEPIATWATTLACGLPPLGFVLEQLGAPPVPPAAVPPAVTPAFTG